MYSHDLGSVPASTTTWYRRTRATARQATALRRELGDWLARQRIDSEHHGHIVLAVYEAVTNAVEHAYVPEDHQATVAVSATYCAELGSLKIVVADRGRWRRPHPRSVSDARGRGRSLIDLSTSRALWILAEAGTTLAMHWTLSGPAPVPPAPTLRDATGAP